MTNKSITAEIASIDLKFANIALLPSDAIGVPSPYQIYRLKDGQTVRFEFLMSWDNGDSRFDNELSEISKSLYGIDILSLKELWKAKIPFMSNVWHKIKMVSVP
jgi:hypothetical protein